MFLDLYGNSMIRDKTASYLESTINEMIQLVTEDTRCQSVLKELINFDNLTFKMRDDLEDIINSWRQRYPFEMEKLRDQRLRHHFEDRYDFRLNKIDWDY